MKLVSWNFTQTHGLTLSLSHLHFHIFQYISNKMQCYTVYYIWKPLYMFWVVPPPIIRSAYNCIYSIWYLSRRYCYLPLSWNSTTIAAHSSNSVTNTRCCRYSCMCLWWWVGVPPETCRSVSRYNKPCNVASCWIHIGIFSRYTDPWTLNIFPYTLHMRACKNMDMHTHTHKHSHIVPTYLQWQNNKKCLPYITVLCFIHLLTLTMYFGSS